jgi:transcription antitermination protein NusB
MIDIEQKKNMPRHLARRSVLMALFASAVGGETDFEKLSTQILTFEPLPEGVVEFYRDLLRCCLERKTFADSIIQKVIENWELERIAAIDISVLRLGITELVDFPDISRSITMDEAVELAKEFGSTQSSKFVNGVLDASLRKLIELGFVAKKPTE